MFLIFLREQLKRVNSLKKTSYIILVLKKFHFDLTSLTVQRSSPKQYYIKNVNVYLKSDKK